MTEKQPAERIPENAGDIKISSVPDPAPLLRWYYRSRRHLPWREDPTPYHVWISEIMLQQTRVEAVKGYYARFLGAFPDISSLSEAEEETVLKYWEGLGYYSRARNLKKAAGEVCRLGGKMPEEKKDLMKLPGIGSYTAAAISSIAFGREEPAVDGNLLRVFARLSLYSENIRTQEAKNRAEAYFRAMMDRIGRNAGEDHKNPYGDLNQALMDLGALICVPGQEADCENCPLEEACLVHRTMPGRETSLPRIPDAKPRKVEGITVFLIQSGNRTAIRKRPDRGLLSGLYEFPNTSGHLGEKEALAYVRKLGFTPLYITPLGDAQHVFSHIEWHMIGYKVRIDELDEKGYPLEGDSGKIFFAGPDEIRDRYSIPTAFRYYREHLES